MDRLHGTLEGGSARERPKDRMDLPPTLPIRPNSPSQTSDSPSQTPPKGMASKVHLRSGSGRFGLIVRVGGYRVTALEATQGQMDGFVGQLPYKCHLEEVASVRDCLEICPQIDSRVARHHPLGCASISSTTNLIPQNVFIN